MKIKKQISGLTQDVQKLEVLKKETEEIDSFVALLKDNEENILPEIEKKLDVLEKQVKAFMLYTFLNGKNDKGNAILQIFAGAGGRDAQDWVAILLHMYQKYCDKKGFELKILDRSFGESGGPDGRIGIKNVTMEINGRYAFGFLKKEAGVHRLVRISPFSAQNLRHTSFAQVVVLPKIQESEEKNFKIDPKDLKIETFRSSGPGGQYMQKTESAVRITYIPTKIVVNCQSERSQAKNKKKAMDVLLSRLWYLEEQKQKQKIKEFKDVIDPVWGRQIRNYVFHPYQLVKDLRTQVEVANIKHILDGNIDIFIEQGIKLKD